MQGYRPAVLVKLETKMENDVKISPFCSESDLVNQFVNRTKNSTAFNFKQTILEWPHTSGIVDVLAFCDQSSELYAFEAKLTNWRTALLQAYRSTSYAHRVYVLLPKEFVHRAQKHRSEFTELGVGLCSFDGESIKIVFKARKQKPILNWLREKALKQFQGIENEPNTRQCHSRLL